jgi:hypothetical protein
MKKNKQITADYVELCQLVMKMRSQMSDTCAPPDWPHGPGDDWPPPSPPPPVPPLF